MRRILLALLVAALLVLAAISIGASSFITQKARENLTNANFDRAYTQTPWTLGIPHENVTIQSGDLRLAGWWMPAAGEEGPFIPAPGGKRSEKTVILVHGLDSNMGYASERWAPNLHEAGFSLLAIDLRNHGASDDGPQGYVTYGASEADDVVAAIGYVRAHASELGVDPDRIAIFGGSMGGATVLRAGSVHPEGLAAVIADGTYASLGFQARIDGAEQGYPNFLADLVVKRMRSLAPTDPDLAAAVDTIREIQVPLLLSHCTNDTRIQFDSFEKLEALAPAGTKTWHEECPGEPESDHHLANWKMPAFNETVVAFLDGSIG